MLGDLETVSGVKLPTASTALAHIADLPLSDTVGETLRYMRAFVHQAILDPEQYIRRCAVALIEDCAPRDYRSEAASLHAFVRDEIKYIRDPDDYEMVQAPRRTIEEGTGDCDDKATLLAALLKTVGHAARFVAIGLRGAPIAHVLLETRIAETWIPAETIVQVPFGWYPSGVTARYVLKV